MTAIALCRLGVLPYGSGNHIFSVPKKSTVKRVLKCCLVFILYLCKIKQFTLIQQIHGLSQQNNISESFLVIKECYFSDFQLQLAVWTGVNLAICCVDQG